MLETAANLWREKRLAGSFVCSGSMPHRPEQDTINGRRGKTQPDPLFGCLAALVTAALL
jgi:hypothetical protein